MGALIVIVHVIVCVVLIIAVLLQSGKSADLAGAFGGAGSQTAFGGRGSATVLSKITTAAAVIFMLTSLGMWIVSAKGANSVVGNEKAPARTAQPAAPVAQPSANDKGKAQPAPAPQQQNAAEPGASTPDKK